VTPLRTFRYAPQIAESVAVASVDFFPASGHASHTFTVAGAAIEPVLVPTRKLTGHATCAGGTPATFTLGASTVPLGIAGVQWDFGDGTSADGSPATHNYLKAGVYRPSVTVTDLIGDVVTVKLAPLTIKKCC